MNQESEENHVVREHMNINQKTNLKSFENNHRVNWMKQAFC